MKLLFRFLKISRAQWPWMISGVLLGVVVIAANTLLMAVSGWFLASMAVAGNSGTAFNYFFPSASIRFLAIARTVGRYAERLITHEATFRILADLRVWLFIRFTPLAPACLERFSDGDVAGRLRSDVDAMETLYLKIILPLSIAAFSIAAAIIFLAWFSSPSALVMLLFLLLAGLALPTLVRRLSDKPGRRSALLSAELRNRVTEGILGIEELILLGAVDRQAATVNRLSTKAVLEQEQLGRISALSLAGVALCTGTATAAVLFTAGTQVASHLIPPQNLVMLLLFSISVFEAVGPLPAALNHLPAVQESAARIFNLADSPVPVPDNPVVSNKPVSNEICFKMVSASYHPGIPVLHNISFTIPAGECAVVTGPSGVGKTLLIEILLRFRNYEGSISVGGTEIRNISKDSLIEMIGAVPQHPHLFNGTIRENIQLGNIKADNDQLQRSIVDSGLEAWIQGLPFGLETHVGINGSAVSGGEARRIALARALLKNAPILLLDEPTEGLDAATERFVISRLKERYCNSGKTTMLVISHRPACLALGTSITL